MAEIQEILDVLDDIKRQVADIEERIVVGGAQVSVSEGLSDISDNLGLVKAGEFRSGKGTPGKGFSGVRIGWPGFIYSGETYNIVGVDDDTLQFGLRASDGVAVFGGGDVTLDNQGIGILQGAANTNYIWWHAEGSTEMIAFVGAKLTSTTHSVLFLEANKSRVYTNGQLDLTAHADHPVTSSDSVRAILSMGSPTVYLSFASYLNNDMQIEYLRVTDALGVVFNNLQSDLDFSVYGSSTDGPVWGIDAGDNKAKLLFHTPSASGDTGVEGYFAIDAGYIYVHDGTEWRRAALSTF